LRPQAIKLTPVDHLDGDTEPIDLAAHIRKLDLRQAADGWHCLWRTRGVTHELWLAADTLDVTVFCIAPLPWDVVRELRLHAVRSFWRSYKGKAPGREYRPLPATIRDWHTLSLRALDARQRDESYRTIAEVLLGFRGTKEDWESDSRKNQARRLAENGMDMMLGGYPLLLRYPIALP
jgi:hypothetical protein